MVLNELVQVLMWREVKEYEQAIQKIWATHGNDPNNPDLFLHMSDRHLFNTIKTKEEFIRRINDYNTNSTFNESSQNFSHCDIIVREDINSGLPYSVFESGAARHQHCEKAMAEWAVHLNKYGQTVNKRDGQYILELATGAGMGTWAVVKDFPTMPNSYMLSIDIDYPCTRNAEGIAQYFRVANRV